ncbi:aspartate aminotransferase family protein [candidate division KSB1 bacterium]
MDEKSTRRDVIKSLAGFAIGAGMLTDPFNKEYLHLPNEEIKIKVSPPGPKSLNMLNEMKKYVGRTNYIGLFSICLKSGNGIYIQDLDDNIYIDCITGAATNILGYSRDDIANIYYETVTRIQHTAFGFSPTKEPIELSRKLAELAPGNFTKKVLIGLSGSDSIGGAIEASRKFTGKMGIISFSNAYHGSTGLSQAASGFKSLNDGIYDLADPNFVKVPFPISPEQTEQTLKEIESLLTSGRIAAVLAEIIQGDGGTLTASRGFFSRLRDLLDSNGVLLITDEIQSGMGRTGQWWASISENIVPDIMVLGKSLSAGYAPVSAVIGRSEVIDSLPGAAQIFTFGGHPACTAVASKVLDIIENEKLLNNADMIGTRMLKGLKEVQEKYPDAVVDSRGRGLMIGLEINVSKNKSAGKIFAYRCVEKGVYFATTGPNDSMIRVLPPITISEKECDTVLRIVQEVASEMQAGSIPQSTIDKVKKYT